LDFFSEIVNPGIKKESLLTLALKHSFFEITLIDGNNLVINSTLRKRGEVFPKKLIERAQNEDIIGDTLFYLKKKSNFNVFLAKNISNLKEKKSITGIKTLLERLGMEEKIEYLVLETNGEIVFRTKKIEPLEDKKLIEKIRKQKNSVFFRKEKIGAEEVMEVIKSFYFGDEPVGILRLAISLENFKNRIFIYNVIILISIFMFFVSLFFVFISKKEEKWYIKDKFFKNLEISIFRFKKGKLSYIEGPLLNLSEDILKRKFPLIYDINSSKYIVIKEGDFVFCLKIDDIWKLFEERGKKREEEGVLRVLSGFAHEVKNPLNSLKLNVYRLKEKLGEEGKILENSVNKLSSHIEEFLGLLRPFYIEKKRIKLKEFINRVVNNFKKEAESMNIDIIVEGADFEAFFDPVQMEKVFSNLIKNAIEAQKEGGKIVIKFSKRKDKIIVKIRDFGIGIKKEHLNRVFEPYFTTKNTGTGLGLFTVKRIVESHGGEIKLYSEEGKGTEVLLII